MTRPDRYTENNSNRDWIDEFIATSSSEEVRGAFRFTIGKYLRRYGKKDDPLQEAIKIQDYANRLVEFEREKVAPDHVELQGKAQDNDERMPATKRHMEAIGFHGWQHKIIDSPGKQFAEECMQALSTGSRVEHEGLMWIVEEVKCRDGADPFSIQLATE